MTAENGVIIGLSAVIVTVIDASPKVFVVRSDGKDQDMLPFGPFDPIHHRTLEVGLRSWVAEQTPLAPGYVEQLYTFGNKGRYAGQKEDGARVISVGYLALTHATKTNDNLPAAHWSDWYDYFPYEDWRSGKPNIIGGFIGTHLERWIRAGETHDEKESRSHRANLLFGLNDHLRWDEEKVLERYELLYEARLVEEALRDKKIPITPDTPLVPGRPMLYDHRRILATGMGRLRGKLKYRPVVFELMPEKFTLLHLQKTVEAIAGQPLHKQNFRRLVEGSGLVEETGGISTEAPGRPAALYKFRKDVLLERLTPGVKLTPQSRG